MKAKKLSRRQWFAATGAATVTAPAFATAADQSAAAAPSQELPPFQLGLVTYNLAATWSLPTLVKIATDTHLAAVELRTTHAHGVEPSMTPDERQRVRELFQRSPVKLWGLGTTCEFHSPDAKVVEKNIATCQDFLQLAHDLGAVGVKVRPNGLPKEVAVEKTLEQIGKAVAECGKRGDDLGVEVWVEVHGGGTSEPRHMKTIMEAANHPRVGLTWNSNRQDVENGSVASSFALLKPWIKSVHINELYGSYPYRELFKLLREAKYDRYTLIELPQKLEPVPGELLLRYYHALWRELCAG